MAAIVPKCEGTSKARGEPARKHQRRGQAHTPPRPPPATVTYRSLRSGGMILSVSPITWKEGMPTGESGCNIPSRNLWCVVRHGPEPWTGKRLWSRASHLVSRVRNPEYSTTNLTHSSDFLRTAHVEEIKYPCRYQYPLSANCLAPFTHHDRPDVLPACQATQQCKRPG